MQGIFFILLLGYRGVLLLHKIIILSSYYIIMDLKDLLKNFETMTIKDLSTNYPSIKTSVTQLNDKIKSMTNKYGTEKINIDQIPDMMTDMNEVMELLM